MSKNKAYNSINKHPSYIKPFAVYYGRILKFFRCRVCLENVCGKRNEMGKPIVRDRPMDVCSQKYR